MKYYATDMNVYSLIREQDLNEDYKVQIIFFLAIVLAQ